MKKYGLILAIAVILVSNAVALMDASRNRIGDPLQSIELTERELPLQSMGEEDSGISLMLRWRWQDKDTCFDRTRLEAVGFDLRAYDGRQPREIAPMSRIAYVALEYEGKAWEQLQQREGEKQPERPRGEVAAMATRLVPVDLAGSFQELRNRYPDQARYMIVKGLIRVRARNYEYPDAGSAESGLVGFVAEVLPSNLNVPPPFARRLSPLKPQIGKEPRYTVTLQYGRNLEPWISALTIK